MVTQLSLRKRRRTIYSLDVRALERARTRSEGVYFAAMREFRDMPDLELAAPGELRERAMRLHSRARRHMQLVNRIVSCLPHAAARMVKP